MAPFADEDDQPRRPADPKQVAEGNRQLAGLARAMSAAWLLLGSGVVGLVVGWAIDRSAGTAPRWTLIVPVLCIASSAVSLIRRSPSKKDRE
jgi:F0F1-type ATP synthase assembly protein I